MHYKGRERLFRIWDFCRLKFGFGILGSFEIWMWDLGPSKIGFAILEFECEIWIWDLTWFEIWIWDF